MSAEECFVFFKHLPDDYMFVRQVEGTWLKAMASTEMHVSHVCFYEFTQNLL